MVATLYSVTFNGLQVTEIEVQAQLSPGMPAFTLVGLPDKAVSEARERVRGALQAMGLSLPLKRITVNLAPADVLKEGSHFDLPIALAVLAAMQVIPVDAIQNCVAMGELGLNGQIRPVSGILPATMHAHDKGRQMICPAACGPEAAWISDASIIAPDTLLGLINHFKGTQVLSPPVAPLAANDTTRYPDFSDVKGQETAKRALEIAAAGGHNVLMIGPPGSGKSMLASRLPGILPALSPMEALEASMIQSIAGTLTNGNIIRTRPYRDPHHSASQPALVGGGHKAKPGEISLAHHGVLFLDELPEFDRATLESLRQPLETGSAVIARANHHVTYPAQFQLIAAMNPCRCGHMADAHQACPRAPRCGADYQAKLSGPLLDRFDLFVDVPAVSIDDLQQMPNGEKSSAISARVAQARNRQTSRHQEKFGINLINTRLQGEALENVTQLDQAGQDLMKQAADKMKLSARAYHRVLRVARTIADLADHDVIETSHLAEALAFRRRFDQAA
jgi:magnesium chelatase family protein